MKQALNIYFDMTVRKTITLIEIVLLIAVIYITALDTLNLVLQSALITFFILMIIDRIVTFYYQFNAMSDKSFGGRVTQHVLQCYLSPTFRTPRRIAGILFATYALILMANIDADASIKIIVLTILALLVAIHVFGIYLSLNIHKVDVKKRS